MLLFVFSFFDFLRDNHFTVNQFVINFLSQWINQLMDFGFYNLIVATDLPRSWIFLHNDGDWSSWHVLRMLRFTFRKVVKKNANHSIICNFYYSAQPTSFQYIYACSRALEKSSSKAQKNFPILFGKRKCHSELLSFDSPGFSLTNQSMASDSKKNR